jgi:hypothetical protein
MQLNTISGRTYNDLNQYPVLPWILNDYSADGGGFSRADVLEAIHAQGKHPFHARLFRDLSKPVGALDQARLDQILERFSNMADGRK